MGCCEARSSQVEFTVQFRQRQRGDDWARLAAKIGRDYASFRLRDWVYFGDQMLQSRQRKAVSTTNRIAHDLPGMVAEGTNVLYHGPVGTGKDAMMAVLMRVAVLGGYDVDWHNGMRLLMRIQESQRFSSNCPPTQLLDELIAPQILCISDLVPPANAALTDFELQVMFEAIDTRTRQRRPTFLTMNIADREDLASKVSAKLVDRLLEKCMAIPCMWPSYRQFQRKDK